MRAAERDCIPPLWFWLVWLAGEDEGGEEPMSRCCCPGWVGGGEAGEGKKRSATWLDRTIAQSCSRARFRNWCPSFTSCVDRKPRAAPELEVEEHSAR